MNDDEVQDSRRGLLRDDESTVKTSPMSSSSPKSKRKDKKEILRGQSSVSSQLTLNQQQIPILMPTVALGDGVSSAKQSGSDSLKSSSTQKIDLNISQSHLVDQTGLHMIDESVNESKKASSVSKVGDDSGPK